MKRLGLGSVGLRLSDSLQSDLDGRYTAGLIEIALDSRENMFGALRHESIHALKALGAFSEDQWGVLEAAAKAYWVDDPDLDIRRRYGHLSEEAQVEEAVAEAFRRWYGKALAGLDHAGGGVEAVFRWIAEVFSRIRNLFRQRDLTSAEAIFRAIDRGEFQIDPEKAVAVREATVEVASRSGWPQPLPDLVHYNRWGADGLPARPYLLDKGPVPVVEVKTPFDAGIGDGWVRSTGVSKFGNEVYENANAELKNGKKLQIAVTRAGLYHNSRRRREKEGDPLERHSRGEGNLALVAGLDQLLQTCVHFESEPNRKTDKKKGPIAYHHFVAAARNGDEIRRVRLTVEEWKRGGRKYNDSKIDDTYRLYDMVSVAIELPQQENSGDPIPRLTSSRGEEDAPCQQVPTEINMDDLWQGVNPEFKILADYRGKDKVLNYQVMLKPWQILRRDWNELLAESIGSEMSVTSMEGFLEIRGRVETFLSGRAPELLERCLLSDPNLGEGAKARTRLQFYNLDKTWRMGLDQIESGKQLISRESVAEAFRRWYGGKALAGLDHAGGGLVEAVFRWIAEVFNRIRNLFRQRVLTSAEAIFRAIERGEFQTDPEKAVAVREAAVEVASRSREPQPLPDLVHYNRLGAGGLPAQPYLLDKGPVQVVDVKTPFYPDSGFRWVRSVGVSKFGNQDYENTNTGLANGETLKIAVTRDGLRHISRWRENKKGDLLEIHSRGEGNLALVGGLPQLLETCVHFESEPNRKADTKKGPIAYHHFVGAVRNEDEFRRVRLTVEEWPPEGRKNNDNGIDDTYRLYDMVSVAISGDPITRLASSRGEEGAPSRQVPTDISMDDLWRGVNPDFDIFL